MTIRMHTCSCEEEGILESLSSIFGVENVSLARPSAESVVELRGVSKDEALTAVAEHDEGDSVLMDTIAYNGYEEGDEGYPADLPLETTVYIVTASGPRPEKAPGERFYLDLAEAQAAAERLSRENAPGRYSVHEMSMAEPREETTYVYGIDERAAYDTTVVQDGLILNALLALGDDLVSDNIPTIDRGTLQGMADEAGVGVTALVIARAVELGLLEQVRVVDGQVSGQPTPKLMRLFLEHGLAGVRSVMLEDWDHEDVEGYIDGLEDDASEEDDARLEIELTPKAVQAPGSKESH